MKLYQLTIPKDDHWNVMNQFGEIGYAQFLDVNRDEPPHNLPYTKQVKEIEDSERKLAFLLEQCKLHYVKVSPPENVEGFRTQLQKIRDIKRKAIHLLLEGIQKDINDQEKFVQEQNIRLKEAGDSLQNFRDCLQVFKIARAMIPTLNDQVNKDLEAVPDGALIGKQKTINIERIAGVVNRQEVERFKRLIFRATKGKSYMFTRDYEEPDSKNQRSVYIITFYDGTHTRDKIQRICDAQNGQRYDLPDDSKLSEQINKMESLIVNQKNVYDRTRH